MQEKKVCLVIGAGAGIGVNVAKKFASSGYHAVISRRTNQEGLDNAVGIEENCIANKNGLRYEDEFVKHKISIKYSS